LEHARRGPGREYVTCVHADGCRDRLTYGRLVERGSQLAQALGNAGVPRGSFVIVLLPHSTDLYCAFFGSMLGGLVPSMLAVPSFKLNRTYYRQELEALLRHIGAEAVVTDVATSDHLGMGAEVAGARVLRVEEHPFAPATPPDVVVGPDDIALLQHSSGSTGLKKGVALSHRAVLGHVREYADVLGLRAEDRIASWLPLYHDMGLIACTVLPLVAGVPVSALSPLHWVTRPGTLLHLVSEDKATLCWLPNFAYEFLATRVRTSQIEGVRLDSVRGWVNCSEPTIAQSHRRFLERFAPLGVRAETLWTCYAAAETTFAITQSSDRVPPRVERVQRGPFLEQRQALPVTDADEPWMETMSGGVPMPRTEIRIVDDGGRDLPERHVGEIAIRSAALFSGYFRQPEATAAVLKDGWYFSGDLGYRAQGHVFVTGRKKDIIIIGGRNYYPQDLERIVSEVEGIHPGRVVALGHDDAQLGTQRLIVLAEAETDAFVDDPALLARIRAAVSERMDCVIDDLRVLSHMWLLKTSSGKIARRPNLQKYLDELAAPRA
jgi:acyl-CoA synthetase (AMP-forming)/AMP-acid ligase II